MALFGVQLNAQINRILLDLRLTLTKNQYLPNIRTIYRSCAKYDPQQSGWISRQQFEKVKIKDKVEQRLGIMLSDIQALNQNGIFMKKVDMQVIEKIFSHQGTIGWFAFIAHLRQPLSLARGQVLDAIWKSLDATGAGKIEIHYTQLSEKFNASEFKEFKLGFKSKQTILKELIGLVHLTPQGYVTYEQFINFYTDLSVNIPSDETFASFASKMWGHEYKPQPVTKVEEIKAALRTLRFKLLQRTNNTHEEFVLKKIFNEFDANKNGKLTTEELQVMLLKLQIPIEKRLIEGIVHKIARDGSGAFDFQDFGRFVFYDPYHL